MANSKASELKKKFVTGATPSEADYHELIELANVGRKAVGASEGEDKPTAGEGLNYDLKDGKLSVRLKEKSGLAVSDTGLEVKAGGGVKLDANAVKLAIKEQSALCTEGGALHIKTGNGVTEQDRQLTLNVNESSGLSTDGGKLQMNFEPETSGLKLDNGRLAVKYNEDHFTAGDKGLTLKEGHIERLASQFEGALNKASEGTKIGFRDNVNSDQSDLERKIATELRNAYRQGSNPVEALKALTGFFKKFRNENKAKLKGDIALSPQSGNTCLYGNNGEKFTKNCLYIVDPYTPGQSQQADHEELSQFGTGIYGVYGATNTDGNPRGTGQDGKDGQNGGWTQNALMVLVGQGNFAAVLGSWDMASADAPWDGDKGQFSCIPTTDPKQYQTGYADGYTKPTELARIVAEGIGYLEKEQRGPAVEEIEVDDSLPKAERWKVAAKQIWTRWLKPLAPPDPPGGPLRIEYPTPRIVSVPTGVAKRVRGVTTDEGVLAVEPHEKGILLVPRGIGRALVGLSREARPAGTEVRSHAVMYEVEVRYPETVVVSVSVALGQGIPGFCRLLEEKRGVAGAGAEYSTAAVDEEVAGRIPLPCFYKVELASRIPSGPPSSVELVGVSLTAPWIREVDVDLDRSWTSTSGGSLAGVWKWTRGVLVALRGGGGEKQVTGGCPTGAIGIRVGGALWSVKIVGA